MSSPYSWRELLEDKMRINSDSQTNVTFCNLSESDLDRVFQDYIGEGAIPLRVYTKSFVYFSVSYEGSHSLESLPLAPTAENTKEISHFIY